MSELRELYQDTVLAHARKPRNFREIEGAEHVADGHNPLCGDKIKVYVTTSEDGVIEDISFQGQGCAISQASASLMTESLKGKKVADAEQLYRLIHKVLTGEIEAGPEAAKLGKLVVFAGVRDYPLRVKCASLPWHTFHAAMKDDQDTVTTE